MLLLLCRYYTFHDDQSSIVQSYPGMVEEEIRRYDHLVCRFFSVQRHHPNVSHNFNTTSLYSASVVSPFVQLCASLFQEDPPPEPTYFTEEKKKSKKGSKKKGSKSSSRPVSTAEVSTRFLSYSKFLSHLNTSTLLTHSYPFV